MILIETGLLLTSIMVFLLSAVSLTIGQSVVLFANRVPRSRFWLSVLASVAALLTTAVGRFVFLSLILWMLLDDPYSVINLLTLILTSHLPYLFGFLVFLPYLGNPILRLLRLGENLILFVGLLSFGLSLSLTAVVVLGMGLLAELWRYIPFLNPDALLDRFWVWMTGQPAPEDPAMLVEHLIETGSFYSGEEET